MELSNQENKKLVLYPMDKEKYQEDLAYAYSFNEGSLLWYAGIYKIPVENLHRLLISTEISDEKLCETDDIHNVVAVRFWSNIECLDKKLITKENITDSVVYLLE